MYCFAPMPKILPLLLCLVVYSMQMLMTASAPPGAAPFPLFTKSRWIVDGEGRRVKLACVNWASHFEGLAAEGLGKQPLNDISMKIAAMGFNCVRFTWPTFMFTDEKLGRLTVRQSYEALGLREYVAAIGVNNPTMLNLTVIDAFKTMVSNLGDNNIMVILDNHVSKPGLCCSTDDGNGFFGDKFFDPNVWIDGLKNVATIFNGSKAVVGMSLRNGIRGPRQNTSDWYTYMQKGAEAVHAANPDVLVIMSGLSNDNDLGFLTDKQVQLTFKGKLVFELHWYGFSDGSSWKDGVFNDVCARISESVKTRAGFLLDQDWPLFFSEFGTDQTGLNVNDNKYFNCIVSVLADWDADWAVWTLQGSYALRQGKFGMDEAYGMLSWDWSRPRNTAILRRLTSLQQPFRGPGVSNSTESTIIFSPWTGLCLVKSKTDDHGIVLGECTDSQGWDHTANNTLHMKGTDLCLMAKGENQPVELGDCKDPSSTWLMISKSKMQLSTTISSANGTRPVVCIDVGPGPVGYGDMKPCKCLSDDINCDPKTQLYKLIKSTKVID